MIDGLLKREFRFGEEFSGQVVKVLYLTVVIYTVIYFIGVIVLGWYHHMHFVFFTPNLTAPFW